MLKDGELVSRAVEGDAIQVVLDKTPFYPEGGGQVSDSGVITCAGVELRVEKAARVGSLIVHSCRVISGGVTKGDQVRAEVDGERRMSIMRNHSATHLLHRALRMVLGEHVVQGGSLVEPARLRFDFTHFQAITPSELKEIERIVNETIFRDLDVRTHETTLEQAKADGAMALFSEKYSGTVRVVDTAGFSMELCGGTHVHHTSQVGIFKLLSESSVGAGLRRIEAVTGSVALDYLLEQMRLLGETADALKTNPAGAPEAALRLNEESSACSKQIDEGRRKGASGLCGSTAAEATEYNGLKLVAAKVDIGRRGSAEFAC